MSFGDSYKRITPGEIITSVRDRLTILQNVRAAMVCDSKDNVEYECNIYELKDDSYQFDNINELLDSSEECNTALTFSKDWQPIKNRVLRPETSAVVIITMKLNTILDTISSNIKCHCFLLYDISNDTLDIKSSQQYYVRTIEIGTNILCLPEYQIAFDPRTIYRDLLAISATSKLFVWVVEHKLGSIAGKLATFLINTFGFSRLILDNDADERMDVDATLGTLSTRHDILPEDIAKDRSEIFYHQPTGHNHLMGTLIRTESQPNRLLLKIYVREDYKALYIYSTLHREFEEECTIRPITYNWDDCYQKTNLLNFHESLQKEIEIAIDNLDVVSQKGKLNRSEFHESQIKMYVQEFKTDCIFSNVNLP
ncbi:unnamed protein product [Hermetia illucens]|uniref:Uncharacterized protein n=1 Tax=Hermetia illucens TaxID=343691 RepID=A0A7R8UJP8_HERIL|nr:unnamed protein product [Hermetia illucens]